MLSMPYTQSRTFCIQLSSLVLLRLVVCTATLGCLLVGIIAVGLGPPGPAILPSIYCAVSLRLAVMKGHMHAIAGA